MPSLSFETHKDVVHARRETRTHEDLLRLNRDPMYLGFIGSDTILGKEKIQIQTRRFYEERLALIRLKWQPALSELGKAKSNDIWKLAMRHNVFIDWLL